MAPRLQKEGDYGGRSGNVDKGRAAFTPTSEELCMDEFKTAVKRPIFVTDSTPTEEEQEAEWPAQTTSREPRN